MMRPLLLMRTKGLTGPAFAEHTGIRGLSKSVGNFAQGGGGLILRATKGWTGLQNCIDFGVIAGWTDIIQCGEPAIIKRLELPTAILGQEFFFDGSLCFTNVNAYFVNGTLPAGLAIDETTGYITGIPTDETDDQTISMYATYGSASTEDTNDDLLTVVGSEVCVLHFNGSGDGRADGGVTGVLSGVAAHYSFTFTPTYFAAGSVSRRILTVNFAGNTAYMIAGYLDGTTSQVQFGVGDDQENSVESLTLNVKYRIDVSRDAAYNYTMQITNVDNDSLVMTLNTNYSDNTELDRPIYRALNGHSLIAHSASFKRAEEDPINWVFDSGSIVSEPSEEFPADPAYDLTYLGILNDNWNCTPITDAPMIMQWETDRDNEAIRLPLTFGWTYDFYVDWGDGTPLQHVIEFDSAAAAHRYTRRDRYRVALYGTVPGWSFALFPFHRNLLKTVEQLGETGWKKIDFEGCTLEYFHSGTHSLSGADVNIMFQNVTCPCLDGINTTGIVSSTDMFNGSNIWVPDAADKLIIEGGALWDNPGDCPTPINFLITDSGDQLTTEAGDNLVAVIE